MCGRFVITLPNDAMAQLFQAAPANDLPQVPNYNVCPTNPVHVVTSLDCNRRLVPMRWGFIPTWYQHPTDGPLLINARAETIATKPAFASACRQSRCIIPMSGFYEWTKDKDGNRLPWYIYNSNADPLALAGIFQTWVQGDQTIHSCAIVTTLANQTLATLHSRMPVILPPESWAKWLGEKGKGAALLMTAAPEKDQTFHRVDRLVNSNRASGPSLIDKI